VSPSTLTTGVDMHSRAVVSVALFPSATARQAIGDDADETAIGLDDGNFAAIVLDHQTRHVADRSLRRTRGRI
jgi:hypothetical protein